MKRIFSRRGRRQLAALGLLAATAIGLSGCHSLGDFSAAMPWASDKVVESRYQTPGRMVAIWTDAVYNSAGNEPVRGFGGRLYFYNEMGEAVPVEGQLVVYAYDDSNPHRPAQAPARKFVFTPEQFTEHFSETELGASYSVWLPWDQLGGEQMHIALMPMLTTTSGQVVTGSQSLNLLPGRQSEREPEESFTRVEPESAGARPSLSKVRQAAYGAALNHPANEVAAAGYDNEGSEETGDSAPAHLETTTFRPTGNLAELLLAQRHRTLAQRNQPAETDAPRATVAPPDARPPITTAPRAEPQPFSRRPGEAYQSKIYTGNPP